MELESSKLLIKIVIVGSSALVLEVEDLEDVLNHSYQYRCIICYMLVKQRGAGISLLGAEYLEDMDWAIDGRYLHKCSIQLHVGNTKGHWHQEVTQKACTGSQMVATGISSVQTQLRVGGIEGHWHQGSTQTTCTGAIYWDKRNILTVTVFTCHKRYSQQKFNEIVLAQFQIKPQ